MIKLTRALLFPIFVFCGAFEGVAQEQNRLMQECYGESIDVMMRAFVGDDGTVQSLLSLPVPERWGIKLSMQSGEYLDRNDCVPEPVTAVRAVFANFEPERAKLFGIPEYVRAINIRIYGKTSLDIYSASIRDRFQAEGVSLAGGFLWLGSVGATPPQIGDQAAVEGVYLFPPEHLSPQGDRVLRGCGHWSCFSRYWLSEHLYFVVETFNKSPYTDWPEQDRVIQSLLKSFIKSE